LLSGFFVRIFNHMVNYQTDELDKTFSALSDETRRNMLIMLAKGEANVGELAAPFAMSLPAVSKHLKILEEAGLVSRRKNGREHVCSLRPEAMIRAQKWIEYHTAFWNSAFDKLEAYLVNETPAKKSVRKKK
jgi:DNA-binding transcriptional ArsR family regulator